MMCHLPAMCSSMAPGFPRRGPGFQLRMQIESAQVNGLAHCCRTNILAGEKNVFFHGPRGRWVRHFFYSPDWRSSVVDGSDITQAEKPSRMDETSSSMPACWTVQVDNLKYVRL